MSEIMILSFLCKNKKICRKYYGYNFHFRAKNKNWLKSNSNLHYDEYIFLQNITYM